MSEKSGNKGFLKGMGVGILTAVISVGVLMGCSNVDLSSLIPATSAENITKPNGAGSPTSNRYVPQSDVLSDEVLEKIDTLLGIVDYYYLYDYDKEQMVDNIYKAVLSSLEDPYSVYYTEKEYSDFLEDSSGSYCGIGVVVTQDPQTGIIRAVRPYIDSPGYKAGILPEDLIIAIDGTPCTGMDLSSAVALIRGEEGTDVTITLSRDGKEFDVVATRGVIHVETVTYEMLEDNVGYIKIEQFEEVTYDQFTTAFDDLKSQGMDGLVIDLRNNPGGLLNIVVDMLDDILPEGTIVSVKDKYGQGDKYTSDKETKLDVPLVVLVNENSASASEIFSGAVKDYGVGKIVGVTTFGKGIVQTIFGLGDGTGVKVTVEDYYTPSGESIHKKGVVPDVEIAQPDELRVKVDVPHDEDVQLQKGLEVLMEMIGK